MAKLKLKTQKLTIILRKTLMNVMKNTWIIVKV